MQNNIDTHKTHPLHASYCTRIMTKDLFRYLNLKPGVKILDVGCGLGYCMERVKNMDMNARLFGIDNDHGAIVFAKDRLRSENGAGFVNTDAYRLPFKDNVFDIVMNSNMLEHVADDQKVMSEMIRVCKAKGQIVIVVPCSEGPRAKARLRNLGHTTPGTKEFHHRLGYTMDEMKAFMANNKVTVGRFDYSFFFITEILMDIFKWVFYRRTKYTSQHDISRAAESPLFRLYHATSPFILFIDRIDAAIFSRFMKGHSISIEGEVCKS